MTLHIERLSDPSALDALTAEWEKLNQQLIPRTPFTSPIWAKLWWKHLRQTRASRRHEFFVHIVRDSTGRLVAIIPLVITHQPAFGPLRLRTLQFFGASDGSITEHRRVICRPEDEAEIIQTFIRYLHDLKANWDLFLWTGMRINGQPRNTSKVYRKIPEYVVSLPTSWASFRAGLSRNMREKIRKCYKLLSRNGHTFVFCAVDRSAEIPAALDRFLALHAARARFKHAFKHRDYFAEPSRRDFIADCAVQMAKRNQLVIFELEIGGRVVASRMAFVFGSEMYLYYSGFDPAWGKHSVMTTLMCETFKWAIEHGVLLVNLSRGKDLSKLRWSPREHVFHDSALASPTLRGQFAFQAFEILVGQFSSRHL
ncbi:MAG TPA: GNAT family N-acetyltransferase [Rhizomicrobium sp.]|nr:GNAT family N-acetyltransferase [Rhizomicrobium sp.]